MSRRSVVCLVCGLLATCVLAFVAYRYLLSSSGEAAVEPREQSVEQHREQQAAQREQQAGQQEQQQAGQQEQQAGQQEQQQAGEEQHIDKKQAKVSTWKTSDAGSIPRDVLSKVDAVKVEEKTATFTVGEQVSFSSAICC